MIDRSSCHHPRLVLFSRSEEAVAGMAYPISAKYSKTIKRTVRKRAMMSKKGKVLGNVDENERSESLLGLVAMCSDEKVPSFKYNELVVFSVRVLWLSLHAKQKT